MVREKSTGRPIILRRLPPAIFTAGTAVIEKYVFYQYLKAIVHGFLLKNLQSALAEIAREMGD